MSVTSCLVICLLCLCLHGYNARRLATIHKQEKKFQISNQNDIQEETSVAREIESSLSSNKKVMKVECIESAAKDDEGDEMLRKKVVKNDEKGRKTSSDFVDQNISVGSVSWNLPKPKRGAKHPGFNLDYSPPKTHPPSHN